MIKKRTRDEAVEVYRKMLAGERLEDIKTDERIKEIIRIFSKNSTLSAYQISQTTDLTSDLVGALRNVKRGFDHRVDRNGHENVSFAVKWMLDGWKPDTLRLYGLSDETIKLAKKCIKILEAGGGAPELYKAGVSHTGIKSMIKMYESASKKAVPLQTFN